MKKFSLVNTLKDMIVISLEEDSFGMLLRE